MKLQPSETESLVWLIRKLQKPEPKPKAAKPKPKAAKKPAAPKAPKK